MKCFLQILIVGSVVHILPISWVSLTLSLTMAKEMQHIYNTLFVIEFDPMTSLL